MYRATLQFGLSTAVFQDTDDDSMGIWDGTRFVQTVCSYFHLEQVNSCNNCSLEMEGSSLPLLKMP